MTTNIETPNEKTVSSTVTIETSPKKKGKKEKDFRLSSKKIFLTYPQCNLDLDVFTEYLKKLVSKYGLKEYLIVREEHETEGYHFHSYLQLQKKIDTKNPHFLDICGHHGNYKGVKQYENSIEYITKEVFDEAQATLNLRASPGMIENLGSLYDFKEIENEMIELASKGKADVAMERLKNTNPKRYLEQGAQLQKRMIEIQLGNIGKQAKYPFESFVLNTDLQQALSIFEDYIKVGESKLLFLCGSSGIGKTQFALSYLEHKLGYRVLIVRDKEDLKFFNPLNHDAILYDDPDFSTLTREQIISIIDNLTRAVKIRYTHANLRANVPKIITSNVSLRELNCKFDDKAIERRIIECSLPFQRELFERKKTLDFLNTESERNLYTLKLQTDERLDLFKKGMLQTTMSTSTTITISTPQMQTPIQQSPVNNNDFKPVNNNDFKPVNNNDLIQPPLQISSESISYISSLMKDPSAKVPPIQSYKDLKVFKVIDTMTFQGVPRHFIIKRERKGADVIDTHFFFGCIYDVVCQRHPIKYEDPCYKKSDLELMDIFY
jgi:hypothetical protein